MHSFCEKNRNSFFPKKKMLRFATYAEANLVKRQISDKLLGKFGIVSVATKSTNSMYCVEVGVEHNQYLENIEQVLQDHAIPKGLDSIKSPFIVVGKIEAQ
jgi:hypothetical protein